MTRTGAGPGARNVDRPPGREGMNARGVLTLGLAAVLLCSGCIVMVRGTGKRDAPASEVHVVGVYEGKRGWKGEPWSEGNRHGVVEVEVRKRKTPLVLFLCAYEPVLWKLKIKKDVLIDRIYVSGYYRPNVTGHRTLDTVFELSHETGTAEYAHTHGPKDAGFEKAVATITRLTGVRDLKFQGAYAGRSFKIK
jgi:hypothetical protein